MEIKGDPEYVRDRIRYMLKRNGVLSSVLYQYSQEISHYQISHVESGDKLIDTVKKHMCIKMGEALYEKGPNIEVLPMSEINWENNMPDPPTIRLNMQQIITTPEELVDVILKILEEI